MKKFWKWFIGILAGLLVLGLLIGGAFMLRSFGGFRGAGLRGEGLRGFGPGPMHGYGMMPFRHVGMMMPFGGLFGGLIGLGLLVLVVLGIIWLVRALKARQTPQTPVPAPLPVCVKCGQPLQEEWKVCPHCGTKRK